MSESSESHEPLVTSIHINRPVLTQQKLQELTGQYDPAGPPTFCEKARKLTGRAARVLLPDWLKPIVTRNSTVESTGIRDNQHATDDAIRGDGPSVQPDKPNLCARRTRAFCGWLISFFPFIGILRKYDVKHWLPGDLIAGLTVGIMQIPQGMAYAMLATLPPVYGLYTMLFPPLVYFFFGTSQHITIGAIAVISLLTGDFLDKVAPNVPHQKPILDDLVTNITHLANGSDVPDNIAVRVRYAAALSMTVGLLQILMGLFRVGGVVRYMSGPMTSGFTVGVAAQVFTTQVTTLLGVKITKPVGIFAVPRTYFEVVQAIRTANGVTVGLSAVCILIIVVVKTWINPLVVKRIRVPIPIDLIILVLATVTSHYLQLNERFHVKIMGAVSEGVNAPKVPDLSQMQNAIIDIVVLAVVSFSVTSSLVRIFAKKFNHESDFNQELYAYGLANVISSFFQAYPSAGSLSRSAVQVATGGKTQVAALFSASLLVLVLYFIGPLFYSLPNCCLSAIIVVALKGMFAQAAELKYLWKYSLWDFAIWFLTFKCTMILDVKFGLITGIAFSALTVILRTQAPSSRLLERVNQTELYQDIRNVPGHTTHSNVIRVVRYEGNVYYTCAEQFRLSVYRHAGLDPNYVFNRIQKLQTRLCRVEKQLGLNFAQAEKLAIPRAAVNQTSINGYHSTTDISEHHHKDGSEKAMTTFNTVSIPIPITETGNCTTKLEQKRAELLRDLTELEEKCKVQFVILDCSRWTFVDFVGAEQLDQIIKEFRKLDISVLLAQLDGNITETLHRSGKLPAEVELFPTIHDAVMWASARLLDGAEHLRKVRGMIDTNTGSKGDR